jgi:hypothetical protein
MMKRYIKTVSTLRFRVFAFVMAVGLVYSLTATAKSLPVPSASDVCDGPECMAYTPAPSANPVDDVGHEYDRYRECLDKQQIGRSISPLKVLVEACGVDPGMSADEFAERYEALIDVDPTLSLIEHMTPYRELYTAYEFSVFERMDRILSNARSLQEADKGLADLESQLIAATKTQSPSRDRILAGLSIGRHALYYSLRSEGYAANGSISAGRSCGFWSWLKKAFVKAVASIVVGTVANQLGAGPYSQVFGGAAASWTGQLLDD